MGNWIWLVVAAQFILAIVSLIDKYLLTSKKIEKPFVLSFFVSILTAFSLVIYLPSLLGISIKGIQLPSIFNIGRPDITMIAMALVAGYTFFYSLVPLYTSLREADASDIIPVVGAISAITTFILNFVIFGSALAPNSFLGFVLLILGTVLISSLRLNNHVVLMCINAGVLFALQAVMMKSMFSLSSFDHAFFWSRMGTLVVVGSLLLVPRYYGKIITNVRRTRVSGGAMVIGKTILAGFASIMILKAIEFGNVTIVQSLGGLQFIFLMFFALVLGKSTPINFGENNICYRGALQKVVSIISISLGFYLLFF